jgi:hypothetical protein
MIYVNNSSNTPSPASIADAKRLVTIINMAPESRLEFIDRTTMFGEIKPFLKRISSCKYGIAKYYT